MHHPNPQGWTQMTQNRPPHKQPVELPRQRMQARAGRRPPSPASSARLARGGFLTIRDIWAGPAPRGHRHEKRGARRKHHLHIIRQLGGSQKLPPAAAGMPGKAEEDTKWLGGAGREGRLEFFRLAPCAPETKVTWFVSVSLLRTTVVLVVK